MQTYRNINGGSGVVKSEYGDGWIRVRFRDGSTYEYRACRVGQSHIERMKVLADAGNGLNAYINTRPEIRKGWSQRT